MAVMLDAYGRIMDGKEKRVINNALPKPGEPTYLGWHFTLPKYQAIFGKGYSAPPNKTVRLYFPKNAHPLMCVSGLHSSDTLYDAVNCVTTDYYWLSRTISWGNSTPYERQKRATLARRTLWTVYYQPALVAYREIAETAAECAEWYDAFERWLLANYQQYTVLP